jgi:DNA-directed RNA polymerase subunit omega
MAQGRNTLMDPPIEDLLDKVDSKFTLVALGSARARQVNSYYNSLGEGLGKVVPPQVASVSGKPVSIAFEEIAAGKATYTRLDPEEEAAALALAEAEVADAAEATVLTEVIADDLVSDDLVSDDLISNDAVSDDAVSEDLLSDDAVSDDAVSEDLLSDEVASDALVSDDVTDVVANHIVDDELADVVAEIVAEDESDAELVADAEIELFDVGDEDPTAS